MAGKFRTPRGDEHRDAPAVDEIAVAFTTAMDRLIAELCPSDLGIELDGAHVVVVAGGDSPQPRAATSRGVLTGFSFMEAGGGDATVILRDGHDASSKFMVAITLGPNESVRDLVVPPIQFSDGLFADITGQVIGAVYLHR